MTEAELGALMLKHAKAEGKSGRLPINNAGARSDGRKARDKVLIKKTLDAMTPGQWEGAAEVAVRLGITTSSALERMKAAHKAGMVERKGVHRFFWRRK